MNQFTVKAPVEGFSGESAGVVFKDGIGHVNDASKEGRAAIEYFRRRGYTLTPEGADEDSEAEQGDAKEPSSGTPANPFDPAKHNADEVVAYLDTLDRGTDEGNAEFVRVIVAERAGKDRKTITDKEAAA